MMKNLLTETLEAIEKSGHCADDIVFVGSENSGHTCSWDKFVELSDHEYDAGYGHQKVASDLIIVFSDGQKMWRSEDDGSESWKYVTPFAKPNKCIEIENLFIPKDGYYTLAEIN